MSRMSPKKLTTPPTDGRPLYTGATSANGVFVVTDVALADYTGQKTGMTFTDQQAATIANSCFVMFLIGS